MARVWWMLLTAFLACTPAGCQQPVHEALHPASVLHELQPHRLWRKNQNRPLTTNPYFSVPAEKPPHESLDDHHSG